MLIEWVKMIWCSKSPVCSGQCSVTMKCATVTTTATTTDYVLTAHCLKVKHLPEVVEVKSSLYLKLIRLDNKFNFIAIFSLTVKIQYFSPPLSPPPPCHRTQWCCGWVSQTTWSCWAPRPKFGKTDYMEFWNNNKNFKLGKIREMSVAGREADW